MTSRPCRIAGYEFCFDWSPLTLWGDPLKWLFDFAVIEIDKYTTVSILTLFGLQIGWVRL
jgi:hypothetical protein